jgi:hypothetical protein
MVAEPGPKPRDLLDAAPAEFGCDRKNKTNYRPFYKNGHEKQRKSGRDFGGGRPGRFGDVCPDTSGQSD